MRLAAIQMEVAWQDLDANLTTLDTLLGEAHSVDVDLAVLPEMFATGFAVDSDRAARRGSEVESFLVERSRRLNMWIAGSVATFERGGQRPVNEFMAVSPQGTVHRYSKRHLFTLAGEEQTFTAGHSVVTFEIAGVRITPFVCYDLRFATEFWDAGVNTDLFLVVANWPQSRIDQWTVLLRARAVENQAFVLGVNRVGEGGGVRYGGASMLVDPAGAVLGDAGTEESVMVIEVDTDDVRRARAAFPFLADRERVGAHAVVLHEVTELDGRFER